MAVEATSSPLSGLWQPQSHLKNLYYGPSCIQRYLFSVLPAPSSTAFIITGHSIATKTPLIQQLENHLGTHHAGTSSHIKQHVLIAEIDQATDLIARGSSIDTIISVGGGSPIDAAKTISFRMNKKTGSYLVHLAIPTTLSAAECAAGGEYTKADGVKTGFMAPEMGVSAIFYDPGYAKYTPTQLWLATGMRAVDYPNTMTGRARCTPLTEKARSKHNVRILGVYRTLDFCALSAAVFRNKSNEARPRDQADQGRRSEPYSDTTTAEGLPNMVFMLVHS